MITNTLLFIIAISEIARLILTHRTPSKKTHFKNKLQGVRQMVWDLQFKTFKTREIREDVRKEYDMMNSRLAALEQQIATFKGSDEEKNKLEDTKVLAERDCDRFLAQIKQLDLEVEGSGKTAEYPDGVAGIGHQIDSLRELEAMLGDWIKKM